MDPSKTPGDTGKAGRGGFRGTLTRLTNKVTSSLHRIPTHKPDGSSRTVSNTPSAIDNSGWWQIERGQGTPFKRGKDLDRDLALLATSYLLQDSPSLRDLILLIVKIQNRDTTRKISEPLQLAARFSMDLAHFAERNRENDDPLNAITSFRRSLAEVDALDLGEVDSEVVCVSVKNAIEDLRSKYPPLDSARTRNFDPPYSSFSGMLGPVLDTGLTLLTFCKEASEAAPIPYLKGIFGSLAILLGAVKQTQVNREQMQELSLRAGGFALALAEACATQRSLSPDVQHLVDRFETVLKDIANECNELSRKGMLWCYLQNETQKDRLQALEHQLSAAVGQFQNSSLLHIQMQINVLEWQIHYSALNNLPCHPSTSPSRTSCLPGSREDTMKDICDWIETSDETVLWIEAAAGIGKTTLAYHLFDHLQSMHRLAAAAFCSINPVNVLQPEVVIRMLAQDLGKGHKPSIPLIAKAIQEVQGPQPLKDYLQRYLTEPIASLRYPYPLIILIDAVDEWDHHWAFTRELKNVDSSIIRFIITSRHDPVSPLKNALSGSSFRTYRLPPVDCATLVRFFRWRFRSENLDWGYRGEPTDKELEALAALASGLFLWATTVAAFIINPPMGKRAWDILDEILLAGGQLRGHQHQFDALYHAAITQLFKTEDDQRNLARYIGGAIVLQDSLRLSEFVSIVGQGLTGELVLDLQSRLKALQIKTETPEFVGHSATRRTNPVVHPASNLFHLSFLEYVSADRIRKVHAYAVCLTGAHSHIADQCLRVVFDELLRSPKRTAVELAKTLHGGRMYAVMRWPLHVVGGTRRSPVDWVATPQCAALEKTSVAAFSSWATLFLISAIPRATAGMDTQEGQPGEEATKSQVIDWVIRELEDAIEQYPALRSRLFDALEVAVRLEYNSRTVGELGQAFSSRFEGTGSLTDLGEAVNLYREALSVHPDSSPDTKSRLLHNLAIALAHRYELTRTTVDIDEAIFLHQAALDLRPVSDPTRPSSLCSLGAALTIRFANKGSIDDLNQSIAHQQEALSLQGPDDPGRTGSIINLGAALHARYEHLGDIDDLDTSISLFEEALRRRPDDSSSLSNLGVVLHARFEQTGSDDDLDQAILLHHRALDLRPTPHPDRADSLNNLANALRTRFTSKVVAEDIERAVSLLQEALTLRPASHSARVAALANLGAALHDRFEQCTRSMDDLDGAIKLHQEALSLCTPDHPDRAGTLSNLGGALHARYQEMEMEDDLEQAISLFEETLDLRPPSHPSRSNTLCNLAFAFHSRFEETENVSDLDRAVALHEEALQSRSSSHPDRFVSLHGMAAALQARSEHTGSTIDFDASVVAYQEALSYRPGPHPDRAGVLSGLGIAFFGRFRRTSCVADLDQSLAYHLEALELRPVPHIDRSKSLSNIVGVLFARFEKTQSPEDLEEGMCRARELLELCPAPHPLFITVTSLLTKAMEWRSSLKASKEEAEAREQQDGLMD